MKPHLPWIVLVLAAVWLGAKAGPPAASPDGMDLHAFGKLPTAYNGRVIPFDTVARLVLKVVSEQETFVDEEGKRQPAVRWLLDVMVDQLTPSRPSLKHKVLRIVHPQLRDALALPERTGFRYSVHELLSRLMILQDPIRKARAKTKTDQTLDDYERALLKFVGSLDYYQGLWEFDIPHPIPPSRDHAEWQTLKSAMSHVHEDGKPESHAEGLLKILRAYASGDKEAFNAEVAAYGSGFRQSRPVDARKGALESFLNRWDPFSTCKWLYLGAFLLSCISWLVWHAPLGRSAARLVLFTLAVHTVAIAIRVYLSGRAPVTNLYGSALFIGWGAVGLAMILEGIFKLGVGTTVAAKAGFLTLMIADNLSADGDTMAVLQAVLDTNFWLWTHVTSITMGYATTYVAGLIGILYILRGAFAGPLEPDLRRTLARMIYGVICFSIFFSFVGTVLGGLWADDSWGRFWGWDPKENGALLIVIWNAIILHARWGGLVRERGLALLSVFGNIVVSWSWFGVNELSVGLHTYGFTEGRRLWLILFILSQVGIMVIGMVPGFWENQERDRGAHAKPPAGGPEGG